jgi:hypothetical protein
MMLCSCRAGALMAAFGKEATGIKPCAQPSSPNLETLHSLRQIASNIRGNPQ